MLFSRVGAERGLPACQGFAGPMSVAYAGSESIFGIDIGLGAGGWIQVGAFDRSYGRALANPTSTTPHPEVSDMKRRVEVRGAVLVPEAPRWPAGFISNAL